MAQDKFTIPKLNVSLKHLEADTMKDWQKRAFEVVYGHSAKCAYIDENPAGLEEDGDEWVWVRGFKGTDRDMCCRGYQYELGKQFDMPEGEVIELCYNGFHFCPLLKETFQYYRIGDGNRFFVVDGLVQKSYADKVDSTIFSPDKLVAKSIIFREELSTDEIINASFVDTSYWSAEDKEDARELGCSVIARRIKMNTLTNLGYSNAVADYLIERNKFTLAQILGNQTDISMDTRLLILFNGN